MTFKYLSPADVFFSNLYTYTGTINRNSFLRQLTPGNLHDNPYTLLGNLSPARVSEFLVLEDPFARLPQIRCHL